MANRKNMSQQRRSSATVDDKTQTIYSVWKIGFLLLVILFIVASGKIYQDSQNKPDMPERWKVTLIDYLGHMVLYAAKLSDDLGIAHQLNVTRTIFSWVPFTQRMFDAIDGRIMAHSQRATNTFCHFVNWEFCVKSAHASGDELQKGDDIVTVEDVFDGVPVRLYRPHRLSANSSQAAIIYFHGAVVLGNVDLWDALLRLNSANANATLIYIDYRLAPEHGFPAPLEDCFKVTRFVLRNALQYHFDPSNIAVLGESAGGIFAAVIANRISKEYDDGELPCNIKMVIMMMPLLQGLNFNLPSYTENRGRFAFSEILIAKFWIWYMGFDDENLAMLVLEGKHLPNDFQNSVHFKQIFNSITFLNNNKNHASVNSSVVDKKSVVDKMSPFFLNPEFSPVLEKNISRNHPPTLIVTGQHDILRDDGVLYVNHLRRAGVRVWWLNFMNGFHSCHTYIEGALRLQVAEQIQKETLKIVRGYLHDKLVLDHVPDDQIYL